METKPLISFIYASDKNGCIGRGDGSLPWYCKEELEHFKTTTLNHIVIMGMNTWKSLNEKKLPYRLNYVIVKERQDEKTVEGVKFVTLDHMLDIIKDKPSLHYFVIGGAKTFELFEPYVTDCYHSVYHQEVVPNEDENLCYYKEENLITIYVSLVKTSELFDVYYKRYS